MARDRYHLDPDSAFRLRIIKSRKRDGLQYNMPIIEEVVGLIVGDLSEENFERDIIVEHRTNGLQRIMDLHPNAYMAIEEGRFRWIHNNQEQLQTALYRGLMDVIHCGDTDGIYTIEFQKRGLSHAHILLFLDSKSKNPSGEHIDRIITTEIPDANIDPDGFNVVNKFMIHGPCGDLYSRSPCMVQENTNLEAVIARPSVGKTKFTEWFETNKKYEDARQQSYSSFQMEWVWNSKDKVSSRRKKGISIDIRTIDGFMHPTYKGACYAHGLLDDDSEWIDCLEETSSWATGYKLQHLFVTILTHCQVSDALRLWNTHYEILSKDITIMQRKRFKVNNLKLTASELEAYTLFEIESIMVKIGKSLNEIDGMPLPNQQLLLELRNRLVNEELDYNREDLRVVHDTNFSLLNQCQSKAYEAIMDFIYEDLGQLIFIHGRVGTRKTFLWKTIVARLRSKGKIVLPVASSGIAALLLPNGRTAHSRFCIPLDVTAESTSLDKSLRDILSTRYEDNKSRPFGGLTVVCGGDFRQILPVIPRGTRLDIVNASLNSSHLWPLFRVYELNQNMRLLHKSVSPSEVLHIKAFDDWMLQIDDGSYYDNFEDEMLKLPSDICLEQSEHPIQSILEVVYPSLLDNYNDPSYLTGRAILTPKNNMVQELNECIMDIIPREGRTYLSSDNVCKRQCVI
ncbi:uncharacterized protein LOC112518279 [Cynara cardunculus var. scolymus]|uniref:uncharacterized protein LOC112518279 n=1 Tax=Cynara cardunculus var. scolymus TaxID=59895 RepID=UPI000D63059A|nr:uncharacterized protein LOC112518279 [Cynara cardunculus var. scolymus]